MVDNPYITIGDVQRYLAAFPERSVVLRTVAEHTHPDAALCLDLMMRHLEQEKGYTPDTLARTEEQLRDALTAYVKARTTKSPIDDMVDSAMAGVNQALKEDWEIEA